MPGKIKRFVVDYVFGPTRIIGRFLWNHTWGALKKRLDDPQLVLKDTLARMEDEVKAAREGVAQSMLDEKKLARSVDEARAEVGDPGRRRARLSEPEQGG